jgi:glycosyltransferase involved in cell wall biosynthesis
MISNPNPSVCILPRLEGHGGPASFYARITAGLAAHQVNVHHNPYQEDTNAILVIGGTRQLQALWRARRRGVQIIQRLDGINWLHRLRYTGIRHFVRSEVNNLVISFIRHFLADEIVYQSLFIQEWWNKVYGGVPGNSHVIYNAVNLDTYNPGGPQERPSDHVRILVVEGHLGDAQQVALENTIHLTELLPQALSTRIELMIAADVPVSLRKKWDSQSSAWTTWKGIIKREEIPFLDRSAHLLFSAEVNAPCPNSVIEAMACGLPVIGFSIGSLPELVQRDAGRLVPYGGDPWKLQAPNLLALVPVIQEILANQDHFRLSAREWAVEKFNVEKMVESYIRVLIN